MRAAPVLLVLAALPAAPPTAGAQTPDSTPSARAPRPAYVPPRLAVSVTAGWLRFGELQNQGVRAERLDEDGIPAGEASLERILAAEDGLQVGASVLMGLSRAWAVRLGATVGTASLAGIYSGDDPWEGDVEGLPVAPSTDVSVLSAEGALRFRMRSSRRIQPYAELGLGAFRITAADPAFPGAAALTGETSLSVVAGAGAIVPIRGRVAGRLQATGHFFGTPAPPAEGGSSVAAGDTLRVTFLSAAAGPFADPARELLRALRLDLGLSVELGSIRRTDARAARPSAPPP